MTRYIIIRESGALEKALCMECFIMISKDGKQIVPPEYLIRFKVAHTVHIGVSVNSRNNY
jgi:hypothetical protein